MQLPEADDVVQFMNSLKFDPLAKVIGQDLFHQINTFLNEHAEACKKLGIPSETWFHSHLLALSTCLMMRSEQPLESPPPTK